MATAFKEVKSAAAMFPEGSDERKTAASIVESLENASFGTWKSDDMQLLDSCLVDEDQAACQAFMSAMNKLRELHEGSPGNA